MHPRLVQLPRRHRLNIVAGDVSVVVAVVDVALLLLLLVVQIQQSPPRRENETNSILDQQEETSMVKDLHRTDASVFFNEKSDADGCHRRIPRIATSPAREWKDWWRWEMWTSFL